jgi:transcriptional regulator
MYIPPHYRESRLAALHALMREYSFAVLVTYGRSGLLATHLPFMLDPDRGPNGTLVCHLARANNQWRDVDPGAEVLVIFSGPNAYISPQWYREHPDVPTWDYSAVHAYGIWSPSDDPGVIQAVLARTVLEYEAGFEHPWTLDAVPAQYVHDEARGVVAFEIPITRLDGVTKFSQNKPGDIARIIAGLEGTGRPGDLETARVMRRIRDGDDSTKS